MREPKMLCPVIERAALAPREPGQRLRVVVFFTDCGRVQLAADSELAKLLVEASDRGCPEAHDACGHAADCVGVFAAWP